MNQTEELRKGLDELGVEHEDAEISVGEKAYGATTYWECGDVVARFSEKADAGTLLEAWDVSPEQAIAATVGERNPDGLPIGLTISNDGNLLNWMGENYVRQDAATVGAGTCHCTTLDNAWCFSCSSCGKSFPRNELHIAHNHGEINYCPNCGARIEKGKDNGMGQG